MMKKSSYKDLFLNFIMMSTDKLHWQGITKLQLQII